MIFSEREIISFQTPGGDQVTERILWIDDGYVICYVIDLNDENAFPVKRSIKYLEEMLENKTLSFVSDEPYKIFFNEEELKPNHIKKRDKRWESISIIVNKEPEIFERFTRGPLIKEAMDNSGKTKRLIYKYLRQYWQRGKAKNALLPDHHKQGAKGKERKLSEKKTGRPRKFGNSLGNGINVTEEIKKIFEVSIKMFYNNKTPITVVYEEMLQKFFAIDFRYDDGVKKPILKPNDELPSIEQFRYHFDKILNPESKQIKKKGKRKYQLEDRPTLGRSDFNVYGPGWRFQVDATVADVYLVCEFNRNWIIGRPVVYTVMDVFSREVAGLYVGLEGPSWVGAMMAMANTGIEKVQYCKKYGIEINEEDWSCRHFPQTILADRGEFEGYNPEQLINTFNVTVENTPPYRADWKGIIEQHFRTINLKVKPFLPGTVDKEGLVRGGKDYRLDGKLTLKEFTKIMIKCALYHNNKHFLENYNPDEMMINEEVPLIPRELWNWGIKHRSGKLRSYPEDIVKLNLMPTKKATVTSSGIKFNKKCFYSCERALKEHWFEEASLKGSWKINVSYDPRNMSNIYVRNDDGMGYEVCNLLDHQEKYLDKSIYDVMYFLENEEFKKKKHKQEIELQSKVDLNSDIKHIVENAEEEAKNDYVPMSKKERLSNIKENRAVEKERRREVEVFKLGVAETKEERQGNDAPKIFNMQNKEQEDQDYKFPTTIDLLKKKQKEKLLNATRKY
ncbi:Mu transposase C-terminal domain-containing protein [Metabacillus sp. YM-086]|uniref:Mu transposase C-terminal domain-containing protein n=1 Tax=Metabacillus sp. YM-086 TaxID=3341729 RepID=UPI003A8C2DAF